jgi:thiol-disulfide isomerase/thioredoxin
MHRYRARHPRRYGGTRLAGTGVVALAIGCAPPPDFEDPATTAIVTTAGADTDDAEPIMLDPLDVDRLDREASEGPCGYPSPGGRGYGTAVGDRLANSRGFSLVACDGDAVSLADFMCERTSGRADYNRGVFINIGAGWCGPCQEETLEFPEIYDEFHGQGIEFVQVLFQDWDAQAPTKTFCTDWSTGKWDGENGERDVGIEIEFPVVLDQVFDWTSIYLQDPQAATPLNLLIDANGNIRWKSEGQKVGMQTLRTQFDLVLQDPYGRP